MQENSLLLFKLHSFISAKLCFAENTIEIVFSVDHSFRSPFPKWHFCNQKCHLGFSPVLAETPIFVVFGDFEWAQKKDHFPKTDSCNENAQFFYLPNTNSVCLFFKKMQFLQKNIFFVHNQPKNSIFLGFFFISFSMFSYFLFWFLQHKKDKTKSAHFF